MVELPRRRRDRWLALAWVVVLAAGLGLGLGRHPLVDPDEGRSGAIALGMAQTGNFVIPRLNGLTYLDKPVLFFAAEAVAIELLGRSEVAARLPAFLAAGLMALLSAWFAKSLFGDGAAWIAGTVCATAPLTVAMARTAILDTTLSLFVLAALVAFHRAIESSARPSWLWSGSWWALAAWAAMGLGVLTKGPVALLLPLLAAAPYAAWRKRSLVVWHPSGLVALALVVAPWVAAVEHAAPGFLRYALFTETWARVTTGALRRTGPPWYYLPYLLGGCFPWILGVAAAFRGRWRESTPEQRRPVVFALIWLLLPLLFFSLSQSKRPQYVLPLLPAIGLLAAWVWAAPAAHRRTVRAAAISWAVCGVLLLGLAARLEWHDRAAAWAATGKVAAGVLGGLGILAGGLAWIWARHDRRALVALSLPLLLLPAVTAPLMGEIARSRSARELAARVEPALTDSSRLIGIETFSPSLIFYLGRPIDLCSDSGEPLRSNYVVGTRSARAGEPESTLHPSGWWREALSACREPRLFLLRPENGSERALLEAAGLPVVAEDRRYVVLGPCRPGQGGH